MPRPGCRVPGRLHYNGPLAGPWRCKPFRGEAGQGACSVEWTLECGNLLDALTARDDSGS